MWAHQVPSFNTDSHSLLLSACPYSGAVWRESQAIPVCWQGMEGAWHRNNEGASQPIPGMCQSAYEKGTGKSRISSLG